jgi:hypothetical protein
MPIDFSMLPGRSMVTHGTDTATWCTPMRAQAVTQSGPVTERAKDQMMLTLALHRRRNAGELNRESGVRRACVSVFSTRARLTLLSRFNPRDSAVQRLTNTFYLCALRSSANLRVKTCPGERRRRAFQETPCPG